MEPRRVLRRTLALGAAALLIPRAGLAQESAPRPAAPHGGLDIPGIIEQAGVFVYLALLILAIWGTYNVIMIYRTLAKKGISRKRGDALIEKVRDHLARNDVRGAVEVCQSPEYWHTALAQMMAVALRNRAKGLAKVKQLLVMEFHTEVVGRVENRIGSLATGARMGPLLGLLGTVMSMIAAFSRMGAGGKPDPMALASSISLGLWATAAGLLIANPLMVIGNDAAARLRRLRDQTERQLSDFLEVLEQADSARAARAAARAPAAR
jgi:biopolymer transport protein ExbB